MLLASHYSADNLAAWRDRRADSRAAVEDVINHVHLEDVSSERSSSDAVDRVGRQLAQAWRQTLAGDLCDACMPKRRDAQQHGPHNCFDHHRRSADGKPRVDTERGILYAGDGPACCLGEFFADSTEITVHGTRVATISPTTDVTLLDLRNTAALGASTTQAIAAISERKTSQAWSRWW
jgi:hypothetical protein